MQLSIKAIFLSRPYFLTKIVILCVEKHATDLLGNFSHCARERAKIQFLETTCFVRTQFVSNL